MTDFSLSHIGRRRALIPTMARSVALLALTIATEKMDLSASHPDKVRRLRQSFDAWTQQVAASLQGVDYKQQPKR